MRNVLAVFSFLTLFPLISLAAPQASETPPALSGIVQDETNQPVAGVEVTLRSPTVTEQTSTNDLGRFRFDTLSPGDYRLDFDKRGFFRLTSYAVTVTGSPTEISVTLNHEYEVHSQIDVVSTPQEIVADQARHEEELVAHEIRDNPVPSSHTLQNALPTIPGIVQDSKGVIHVAGGRADNTLYLLDGFEVNNPENGSFDARMNVDTVRAVDVATGRYGAQFPNAGSGVLSLQTDTGDDHWRFGTTNFLPSFDFQRGMHLGNWFPRITFSGPIQKGRAWFSDGVSLQHNFELVRELPPGSDTSESWAGDNLFRVQYNVTNSQSIQGNFLYDKSSATRTGLGPFSPAATTTDLDTQRYLVSVKDQISFQRGLLEFGVASDGDRNHRMPQGSETYVLTPAGPSGNYFESLLQNSHRWQGRTDLNLIGRQWHGTHQIQAGFNIDSKHLNQSADRHSVEVRQTDSALVRSINFSGNSQLSVSEIQSGGYVQDSWQLLHPIILQSSFRIDRNDFIGKTLLQPRLIVNWVPRQSTKFSVGWGRYYQPVYLSVIGQTHDQQRLDFLPGASPAFLLTSFFRATALRQPNFQTTSAEWQQQWNARTISSIHFMDRSQRNGLVYENVSPDPSRQDLRLNNSRRDRYRSVEVSVRRSLRDGSDLMLDYTYSRARSNQIFDYSLEDFVLAPQASGALSWDTPHRLISRGSIQTGIWSLLFSYFAEYHTGFPFSAVNSRYQLVGSANTFRFPNYFAVNIGAEKRFPFYGYQWAVRLSVINATGNHNYNSVINNVDSPDFLTFAGGQSRTFTARLRLVGRK